MNAAADHLSVLAVGKFQMGFGTEALRTLVVLVFGSQAALYAIRERRRLWHSRPSLWVIVSSVSDVFIISTLATLGIFMVPLSIFVVASTLAAAITFAFVLDFIKVPIFSRLKIA